MIPSGEDCPLPSSSQEETGLEQAQPPSPSHMFDSGGPALPWVPVPVLVPADVSKAKVT